MGDRLAQYIASPSREGSDQPNEAYWEENWQGVTDDALRHTLRPRGTLGVHGWFFRRNLERGGRVLEAGCGTGLWVRRLNDRGYRTVGLDYACKSLLRSKRIAPDLPLVTGDLRQLPYPHATFDAYVSFGVIEHFRDGPASILQEAYRVLKPGGKILASAPFENTLCKRAPVISEQEADSRGLLFHQYLYGLQELRDELGNAGFKPDPDYHTYGVWLGLNKQLPLFRRIARHVPFSQKLGYLFDFVPFLPQRAAHMIFAVARRP
jgi:SAM-dependent methyltransferase